jgi:hypothetical protein
MDIQRPASVARARLNRRILGLVVAVVAVGSVTVEIRGGLKEGDVVVLSDTSAWDTADRIRLK